MLKIYHKSEFFRNVLTLLTGTAIASIIPIALSPILTRIYTPADFGILALFMSMCSVISSFATGSYEMAIILPKSEKDSLSLVSLSLRIALVLSIIAYILVIFFNAQITLLLENEKLSVWLYFVPVGILLLSSFQVFFYWENRNKAYKTIAVARISQSSGMSLIQVGLGFLWTNPAGLIIGRLSGMALSSGILGRKILGKIVGPHRVRYADVKAIAIKYKNFPQFMIFTLLISSLYDQMPVFFLTKNYDVAVTGYFAFAMQMISVPGILIAKAAGDVFRQKAIENFNNQGRFDHLLMETLKKFVLIAIIPFLILFFFIPEIFTFVFGAKWHIAGQYAQILTVLSFVSFIIAPVDMAAIITQRISYEFRWHLTRLIANVVILFIVYNFQLSVFTFLYLYVTVGIVFHFVNLFYMHKFSMGEFYSGRL